MARDDPSGKRPRGPRAFVAWCMASSSRRALLGVTLGVFGVFVVVSFITGYVDEDSSGIGSMLSASAFTTTVRGSASSSDTLASPTATSIRSEHEGDSTAIEPQVVVTTTTTTSIQGEEGGDAESTTVGNGNSSSEGDDDDTSSTEPDIQETYNSPSAQTTTSSSSAAPSAATTSSLLTCPYYDDTPSPFPTSFWYVKNPKTASSTLGGVFRSVAAHHGVTMLNADQIHMDVPQLQATIAEVLAAFSSRKAPNPPLGLANHMPFNVSGRDLLERTGPLMLFTSVREPVSQFHSQYVEDCKARMRKEKAPMDCFGPAVEERTAMATAMEPDTQYAYVRGDAPDAESAAAQYDFIFVRERLEESLVAFMILHGLDFDDIAHVAAKVRTAKYPGPEQLPAELNELVRSKTTEDAKLWAKVNALLDEKIAAIHSHCGGEAYFASMLAKFRSMQEVVTGECTDYHGWYDKHGFSTVLRYWGDNGLAPRCRDFVVRREMRAWQEQHMATAVRAATAKAVRAAAASQSGLEEMDGWGRPRGIGSVRGR